MLEIRVAAAQLAVTNDIESNLDGILHAVARASAAGADILLTPEGSLSGYTHEFDTQAVERALAQVTARAREAQLGLALGTCFVEPGDRKCYNQMRFYGSDGDYLGFHSKILRCGSLAHPPEGEINHFSASSLRTFDFNGAIIGGLICNDLWANPGCTPMPDSHLSQQLADLRVQVIFHAANGGRDGSTWSDLVWQYHESNLRMRARAGHVWIVTVDSSYPPNLRCSAPSGVIDPNGEWVCRAEPKGEQFFAHTIALNGAQP